jgi:hypothetical protein
MNQCMRPCQLAVTAGEYAAEANRVAHFLESNGKQMTNNLMAARERACEQTEFEQAARIHRDIERLKAVLGFRDSLITDIKSLNGIALTPGRPAGSVVLWPVVSGYWQEPLRIDFAQPTAEAKSLDHQLKHQLVEHLCHPAQEGDRLEHVALLSRWYFSTWCDGTWLPFHHPHDLDYRVLVRRISALLRDKAGENLPAPL